MKKVYDAWIVTASGKQFFPFNPDIESIDIKDIAHALSNMCRFSGHTVRFYSVAQHSVIVSRMLINDEQDGVQNRLLRLAGLLHDAAEAYTFDCPSPILRSFLELKDLQDNLLTLVAKKFDIPPGLIFSRQVYISDMRTLMTEKRDLITAHPQSWEIDFEPFKISPIKPMLPSEAEEDFLTEFNEIMNLEVTLFEGMPK